MAQAAAFTLLNPHVYLDTVLLVGSIGAQQPAALRGWFIAGASSASLLWFALLGFGARWLAPWFARPRAWQVLDGLIGCDHVRAVGAAGAARPHRAVKDRCMYVNPLHRLTDREALFALMASHPLGAWVCHGRDGLVANHVPFLLDRSRGPLRHR